MESFHGDFLQFIYLLSHLCLSDDAPLIALRKVYDTLMAVKRQHTLLATTRLTYR